MASMTFLINDSTASTGAQPTLQVTVTENADGTVTFNITQIASAGAALGDLRGLFFDVADETLLGSLKTLPTAGLTELQQGNDSVVNLGDGATMAGLVGDNGGYDVGVEIGTSGVGADDIRSFSFTLDSTARNLTLADFSGVSFGVRLTSVGIDLDGNGTIDTARTGSTKLGEVTVKTITPVNDSSTVAEDAVASGNVLTNDGAGVGDTLSVTGWTGGALGTAISPAALFGATVTLNADGSYVVDASGADALAAGQTVTQTFTYTVLQTNVDGTSSQTATFTVTITGTNDVPVAQASTAAVQEDATVTGSVSATDADAGEAATLSYALTGAAPTGLTFNTNGSYSFDASSYDSLKAGEQLVLTVPFTASDAGSTSAAANLVITITGTNDAPEAVADTKAATEDTIVTGSVATNDSDIDHDAVLTYAATGTVPAGLTINSDGSYSFNAGNAAYQALAEGATQEVVASYTVTDQHGATDTSTLTITVTGVAEPLIMTSGGPGQDTVTGTSGNDVLYGGPSGDELYGAAGNDALYGDQAADSLYGGLGNDTLTGGAGNDLLYFDTALSPTNIDTIVGVEGDLLMLDNTVFGLGTSGNLAATAFKNLSSAVDADDRILYDATTGNLFFDADGSGAGAAVQFATVTGTLQGSLDAGDFRLVP